MNTEPISTETLAAEIYARAIGPNIYGATPELMKLTAQNCLEAAQIFLAESAKAQQVQPE